METVVVNGKHLDVIELFPETILVQDIVTKEVFLILYCQVENESGVCYNNSEVSNIISLEYWKKCQKKEKAKKPQSKKLYKMI